MIFRLYIKGMIVSAFLFTIMAFILAFLAWFFGGIIMGLRIPAYMIMVRWIFILFFCGDFLISTPRALWLAFRMRSLSAVWNLPLADVQEGFVTRKYLREKGFRHWGKNEFVEKLERDRAIESISHTLADTLCQSLFRGR